MRAPSVERIERVLGIDRDKALTIRALMKRDGGPRTDIGAFPQTEAWVQACYHRPPWWDVALHAIDEALGTHGIEGWSEPDDVSRPDRTVSYCNTGDSYAPTVALLTEPAMWGTRVRWYLGSYEGLVR